MNISIENPEQDPRTQRLIAIGAAVGLAVRDAMAEVLRLRIGNNSRDSHTQQTPHRVTFQLLVLGQERVNMVAECTSMEHARELAAGLRERGAKNVEIKRQK